MQYYNYINRKNKEDGPHDLVTILRRIRSGSITPDTLVYQGEELVPAYKIKDISPFFNNPADDIRHELTNKPSLSIANILKKGWRFTSEYQNMSVFAGGILLLSVICGALAYEIFHSIASGIMAGWIVFLTTQSVFLAVALRLKKKKKPNLYFLDYTLTPLLGKLAFISVIFSLIIIAGLPLLIVPSTIAMLIYAYVPMFILDYDASLKKTLISIFSLLRKLDYVSLIKLSFLMLLYIICIILIFPIPLAMPILAGGLCSVYEDLSTS